MVDSTMPLRNESIRKNELAFIKCLGLVLNNCQIVIAGGNLRATT
jgi:hypothetical protein